MNLSRFKSGFAIGEPVRTVVTDASVEEWVVCVRPKTVHGILV